MTIFRLREGEQLAHTHTANELSLTAKPLLCFIDISSVERASLKVSFTLCLCKVAQVVVEAEAVVVTLCWSRNLSLSVKHKCSKAGSPDTVSVRHFSRLAVPTKSCDSSSCTQNKQARPLQKILWGILDLPRSPGTPNAYHLLSLLALLGLP